MHTKDFLAQELNKAGLPEMAARAAKGHYHDFLSPLTFPEVELAHELLLAGTKPALALRARVINGDFDASLEESEEWAASAEGQAVMNNLIVGRIDGEPKK